MAEFLEELIPTDALIAWYPLNDVTSAGNVTTVTDYSGNGRDLEDTGASNPNYVLNGLGGRPYILFSGEAPLVDSAPSTYTAKTVAVLAAYTGGTTFGAGATDYNGLISYNSTSSADPILVGDDGTTQWYDFTQPTPYYLNGTFYADASMEAPMTDAGIVQISYSTGWGFDASNYLQVGKDRGNANRTWQGPIYELMVFNKVLSTQERLGLDLYFNLKFNLYAELGIGLTFPSPSVTGIDWARYRKVPRNWGTVTIAHTYEDESKTFSDTSDTPPQFWEVGFTGLSPEQAEIFDEFWEAARLKNPFTFIDKYGVSHSDVRIASFERDHDANKSWSSTATFQLVKYY
jgi:hypothetical protein